jgi:DNA-directed RNA polymerase subunit RPC12/RpoP
MPLLIECTNCKRKLRLQDHLLGKMVRCPNCQIKILAQVVPENQPVPPAPLSVDAAAGDVTVQPGKVSLENSALEGSENAAQALEITEPASSASAASTKLRSAERITASPAPPPVTRISVRPPAEPAPPQRFETSVLKVLAVLVALVFIAAAAGCGLGWWLGATVENAVSSSIDKGP